MTKVSLVMPFLNVEPYIGSALESLHLQEYTDWELWAVDDGSTDQSRAIADDWAAHDRRIRVLNNPGTGIIPALVEAQSHCSGRWISRMDSDDIATPDKLSQLVDALNYYGPKHVAIGRVRYFSAYGISEGYQNYEYWINGLTLTATNFRSVYKECVVPSPCWLMYLEDFLSIGGFYSSDYPEDYDLCFRMHRAGLGVAPVGRILHWWRDYPQRTSRTSHWYAQNSFLEMKLRYYLDIDHDPHRPLILWGAGWKGKQIARILAAKDCPFTWICDNPRKWGKSIYDQPLLPLTAFDEEQNPRSIIAVANPVAQREIRQFLNSRRHREHEDYCFFC